MSETKNLPGWVWVMGLVGSLLVGWATTSQPLLLSAAVGLLIGGFALVQLNSLWLIIFTLGIHFDDLYVPLSFAKVGTGDFALVLLLGYWMVSHFRMRHPIRLPDGWPLVIIYVIGMGVSWQLGIDSRSLTGLYLRQCFYVLGYFMLVDLMTRERHISLFIMTTLVAVTVHSIIALLIDNPNARTDGLVGQPNIFGALIGPGALISFALVSERSLNFVIRSIALCLGTLILIVLAFTVSRGAQVAFLCAILWMYRDQWHGFVILAAVGFIGVQFIMILEPEQLNYIFARWELEDGSVNTRQEIIWNSLYAITEYPIFGIGFAQFSLLENVVSIEGGHGRASHNHYLGELATLGIPSALSLFYFIFLQGRGLWRLSQRISSSPDVSIGLFNIPRELYILTLQGFMIFQSVTLGFRGGRRMIEWSFLALYTAAILIDQRSHASSPLLTSNDERGSP